MATLTGLSIVMLECLKRVEGLEGVAVTTCIPEWTSIPACSVFFGFFCLVFFAFTTILGWDYYSENVLNILAVVMSTLKYTAGYTPMLGIGPYMTVSAVYGQC